MMREAEEKFHQILYNGNTHSYKVEGLVALEKPKVTMEGDIAVGDLVDLFVCPDGRYLLSKATENKSNTLVIERISSAYIYFQGDINIEEV